MSVYLDKKSNVEVLP